MWLIFLAYSLNYILRLIIRRGGTEDIRPCQDSATVYTIHKDYQHPYFIDVRHNKAIAQYSYYYIDGAGMRKNVTVEGERLFPDSTHYMLLQDAEETCRPREVYGPNQAVEVIKCKRKFFIKPSGEKMYATECADSDVRANVRTTRDGCPLAHDFGHGRSFYQSRRVYQFPSSTVVEYAPCEAENRVPLMHVTVACEPEIVDGKRFD